MRRSIVVFVAVGLTVLVPASGQSPDLFFAQSFTDQEIGQNPDSFIEDVFEYLGRSYHQPGVAFDADTGMAYDGHQLDFETGALLGPPRAFSAPSKDAEHLLILAYAIGGNQNAMTFVSPDDPELGADAARMIVERKMATYNRFREEFPGFGGYLNWYEVKQGSRISPSLEWTNKMPGLDNGQFALALFQTAYECRRFADANPADGESFDRLADEIVAYIEVLADNGVRIFFDPDTLINSNNEELGTGVIKAEASVADNKLPPDHPMQEYGNAVQFNLTDPYEGELMVLFLTLFGDWSEHPDGRDRIWSFRMREFVDTDCNGSPISIERPFWGSAHERWNYLQMPYVENANARLRYDNLEKVRLCYSERNAVPGLMASTHLPVKRNAALDYYSQFGMADPIAFAHVEFAHPDFPIRHDVVAPYAAFPTALTSRKHAALWLHRMMVAPRGTTPFGLPDALQTDGMAYAPIVTADGNLLPLLGFLVEEESRKRGKHPMAAALEDEEMNLAFENENESFLEKAMARIAAEFNEVPEHQAAPDATDVPTNMIPEVLPHFPAEIPLPDGNVLAGALIKGGGELSDKDSANRARIEDDGDLLIPHAPGFFFLYTRHIDIVSNPFLEISGVTTGGEFRIELKDPSDRLIGDFIVSLPFTDGNEVFSLDLRDIDRLGLPRPVSLVVFADPTAEFTLRQMQFNAAASAGSVGLIPHCGIRFQNSQSGINILAGAEYNGSAENPLFENFTDEGGVLQLPEEPGFIFAQQRRVDLEHCPIVLFEAKTQTENSEIGIEFKNSRDELIGDRKLLVHLPPTGNEFRLFACDLREIESFPGTDNPLSHLFAISDPTSPISIRSIQQVSVVPAGADLLGWHDIRFSFTDTVELLEKAEFLGEPLPGGQNDLFFQHLFAGGELTLPRVSGFVFSNHRPVCLASHRFVTFEVATCRDLPAAECQGSAEINLEWKNAADQLIAGGKVRIAFPDTAGKFSKFTIDLHEFPGFPQTFDTVSRLFAISDPTRQMVISSIAHTSSPPAGSTPLGFDRRRYVVQPPFDFLPPLEFNNVLPFLNFTANTIRLDHEATLDLSNAAGFMFAGVPQGVDGRDAGFDLNEFPFLSFIYFNGLPSSVFVELKNASGQRLVGVPVNDVDKVAVNFPGSLSRVELFAIDLRDHLIAGIGDREVAEIALSDPGGPTRIFACGFSRNRPQATSAIASRLVDREFQVSWFGERLERSTDLRNWTREPNLPPISVPVGGTEFFRLERR